MEREPGGPQERAAQGGAEYRSNPESQHDPHRPRAVPAAPKYSVPPAPPPKPRAAKDVSAADLTPPATRAPFAKPVPPAPREPHPRNIKLPPAPVEDSPLATPTPPPSKWVECPYTPLTPKPAKAPAIPPPAPSAPPPLIRGPLAAAGRLSAEPEPVPLPSVRHDAWPLRVGLFLCIAGLIAGHLLARPMVIPGLGSLVIAGTVAGMLVVVVGLMTFGLRRAGKACVVCGVALPVAAVAAVLMMEPFRNYMVWGWHPVASGRVTLGAAGLGLALAIAYALEILLRRLRLPLGAWVVLLCAHAAGMVMVLNYFAWRGSEVLAPEAAASGRVQSPANLLLLAAALAALELRAAVAATHAARWLPSWMTLLMGRARGRGPAHTGPLASPCLPVLALYAVSPLAWWLATVTLLGRWYGKQPLTKDALLLALPVLLLAARLLVGVAAMASAWASRDWAGRVKDDATARAARWYLRTGGLAAAGLLAMYALFVMGQRVQQEALVGSVRAQHAEVLAELDAARLPRLAASRNAVTFYQNALMAMPPGHVTPDEWRTPDAAEWLRAGAAALSAFKAGARTERAAWFETVPPEERDAWKTYRAADDVAGIVPLLLLEARSAGLDRDWATVLFDARCALALARHLQEQPMMDMYRLGARIEQSTAMMLLPALLWHPDGPAEDEVLQAAEQLLREHETERQRLLPRAVRLDFLIQMHYASVQLAERASAWPGLLTVPDLLDAQPLPCLLAREEAVRWTQDLERALKENALSLFLNGNATPGRWTFGTPGIAERYALRESLDALANLRIARVALGAVAFCRRRGYWPWYAREALAEFGEPEPPGPPEPPYPEDPYLPCHEVRVSSLPPRVWCASGPGDPRRHPERACVCNVLNFTMQGGYGEDLIFFLEPPPLPFNYVTYAREQPDRTAAQAAREMLDPDPLVWKPAAKALAKWEWHAWIADREVRKMAADPDPERRTWAAFLLGTMDGDRAFSIELLGVLAADPDPLVSRFARESQRQRGLLPRKKNLWDP